MTTYRQKLEQMLVEDEGCILHAYEDHLGFTTIGVGRLIDERRGGGISMAEAMLLLDNDLDRLSIALRDKLPRFNLWPESVRLALMNMGFQLGVTGLLGFQKMLRAMEAEDWETAAKEALDSKWAKEDTPVRAKRIAALIREGGGAP